MKKFIKQVSACIVCFGVMSPVFATNGYFAHGYGTKNKALAGAGVALPQDAMIAATNPAGMVWVGDRIDLGLGIFSPSPRSYEATAPGGAAQFPLFPEKVESDSDYFFIPHFGKNWILNPNATIGLTVYGNGGMNTDYPGSAAGGNGTFGAGAAGVDLSQLFINTTYSRKINAQHSWGVSLILAYQRFKATGLGSFAAFNLSNDPNNLTDNGYDDSMGWGLKIGWQGEVTPGLTLGASYQSETQMSEFDKYKGLFAEQGGFNIPSTWTIGLAYAFANNSKIVFDVQGIMYSDIKAVSNPLNPSLNNCFGATLPSPNCLGGDNGSGFGWEDMTIYKLGYQWNTSTQWAWRVGYSITDQPIPNSEVLFNILAPGVMEDHLTFGFTRFLTGGLKEFNFALMYAPSVSVTGPNPLGDGQQITLEMTQWEIEASFNW
ncbi:MAG: SalD [Gammaproteobacteria bacterium SG8_15]|nr:MAG: SalD [Gammaproteobacteria bacterium SG8_15]